MERLWKDFFSRALDIFLLTEAFIRECFRKGFWTHESLPGCKLMFLIVEILRTVLLKISFIYYLGIDKTQISPLYFSELGEELELLVMETERQNKMWCSYNALSGIQKQFPG